MKLLWVKGSFTQGTFYEKELQKNNQIEFRIKKVSSRKGNKLYVKWKGYDSSFNTLINNKGYSIRMSQNFLILNIFKILTVFVFW